jgi:hypothetical protein
MMSRYKATESERQELFWAKVDKSGDCWNWLAGCNANGYGRFSIGYPKKIMAHRWSYEQHYGPIPQGMQIDHICRNIKCVNPCHLRAVTDKQNKENVGVRADSTTGVRGVTWHKHSNKWRVQVSHNKVLYFGGLYRTIAEAEAAAITLRNSLFTHNDTDRKVS